MKVVEINNEYWLEPIHVNLTKITEELTTGVSIEIIRNTHNLEDLDHWNIVAKKIFELWKQKGAYPNGEDVANANVNRILAPYSLCFPPYGTRPELHRIQNLLTQAPPNIIEAIKIIFAAVMHPRMRALQLVGRFQKLDIFQEFSYFIEASTLAYYRRNIACAFLTILPTIEGILLRWQGYPGILSKKPDFEKTKKFIKNTISRQPMPSVPAFFDSWVNTVDEILQNHLYKHSDTGDAFDQFNRHLALHMLDDKDFCTQENVMRAFLLLDLLSEMYVCEKHLRDPRWPIKPEDEAPHIESYTNAISASIASNTPESILINYPKHKM